jgi:DNA-binding MarR family transcriptional regulator
MRRNNSAVAEETVNNLRRLFQIVNKQSKSEVCETGLSGPQLWAVKVLTDLAGNPITVSKLANQMCLNTSTVVRILDGLETKGVVLRTRSTNDRRIVNITLTDKGGGILNQSPNVAHNLLLKGLNMLSENRLHTIATGLSQLVNLLDSEDIPSQSISTSKIAYLTSGNSSRGD